MLHPIRVTICSIFKNWTFRRQQLLLRRRHSRQKDQFLRRELGKQVGKRVLRGTQERILQTGKHSQEQQRIRGGPRINNIRYGIGFSAMKSNQSVRWYTRYSFNRIRKLVKILLGRINRILRSNSNRIGIQQHLRLQVLLRLKEVLASPTI